MKLRSAKFRDPVIHPDRNTTEHSLSIEHGVDIEWDTKAGVIYLRGKSQTLVASPANLVFGKVLAEEKKKP